MVKAYKPTQDSIDNFNLVWQYAECSKEEAKYEKNKILCSFDEMDLSYKIMADNIRCCRVK
jgi:hypothetical protein